MDTMAFLLDFVWLLLYASYLFSGMFPETFLEAAMITKFTFMFLSSILTSIAVVILANLYIGFPDA